IARWRALSSESGTVDDMRLPFWLEGGNVVAARTLCLGPLVAERRVRLALACTATGRETRNDERSGRQPDGWHSTGVTARFRRTRLFPPSDPETGSSSAQPAPLLGGLSKR